MKSEDQVKALMEYAGWTYHPEHDKLNKSGNTSVDRFLWSHPDHGWSNEHSTYLTSRDALVPLIAKLRYPITQTLWSKFVMELRCIVARDRRHSPEAVSFAYELILATAPQLAEALLRAINKWKD